MAGRRQDVRPVRTVAEDGPAGLAYLYFTEQP